MLISMAPVWHWLVLAMISMLLPPLLGSHLPPVAPHLSFLPEPGSHISRLFIVFIGVIIPNVLDTISPVN